MSKRHIFHPTDFSHSAQPALRFALETARRFHARLHVGHVVYGDDEYRRDVTRALRDELERRMEEAVAEARRDLARGRDTRFDLRYHVIRHRTPSSGIAQFARDRDMDLVVMGTHGRRGLRRFLLGSVALSVLHASHRDLVLVPQHGGGPIEGRMLVPVDLNERSGALVTAAGKLGRTFSSPIDFLHVLDIPLDGRLQPGTFPREKVHTLNDVAVARLRALAENLDPFLTISIRAESGRPVPTILRYIEEHGVRMVLMSASGMSPDEHLRRRFHDVDPDDDLRWEVSQVTQAVVSQASIPVWIMKEFEGEDAALRKGVPGGRLHSSKNEIQP